LRKSDETHNTALPRVERRGFASETWCYVWLPVGFKGSGVRYTEVHFPLESFIHKLFLQHFQIWDPTELRILWYEKKHYF